MYIYICRKCNVEFETKKKGQIYCSKSCANSINTSRRKVEDESIYSNGLDEVNSYILGIIYSDGCLSFDRHSHRNRITISMNDYDLMHEIHELMTPNKKLYEYTHPKGREKTYSVISTNKADIEFLVNLGVKERKSLILRYPNIDEVFDKNFIRGYFDGDGSVYKSKTNTYYKGVKKEYIYKYFKFTTGSEVFAKQLSEKLRYYGIESNLVKDSRLDNSSYYISIYKKDSVNAFAKFIYDNAKIYMKRKYDKFFNMI